MDLTSFIDKTSDIYINKISQLEQELAEAKNKLIKQESVIDNLEEKLKTINSVRSINL
jgi:hypothetical protein